MNIKEIIVRLKFIISMIMMKISDYSEGEENLETLKQIMDTIIREYIDTELNGSYYNLLKSNNYFNFRLF
jgi:uncharacterized protein (DUF2164 family)